jgi:uroporphyrin-III C-methyltransferase/precorrin-2 dehydrogenase/sirohydrochlorin ferrochelatase
MKKQSKYLPLFFNLEGKPCLVVGGGEVALRKVKQLLAAGALVTVIAPHPHEKLKALAAAGSCVCELRGYHSPEAMDYHLVIAATDDVEINRLVFRDCSSVKIPVNVVDQPDLCTVIFPAVIRREFVTLAIGSEGSAPFFTRYLREKLEDFLSHFELLENADLLVHFRKFVTANVSDPEVKKRLYQRFLSVEKQEWREWSASDPPYPTWEKWLSEAVAGKMCL